MSEASTWRRAALAGVLLAAVVAGSVAAAARTPLAPVCKALEQVRRPAGLPGLTAAVAGPDGSTIEFALGQSAGNGRPIEPGAKFLSGSIGKTFVAAIAIDLHERGVLDLDAPVRELLGDQPWFAGLPNACCVTLRQLLNHSSGWPSHVSTAAFQAAISERIRRCPDCVFPATEAIGFVDGQKALYPPGSGYTYSETNYLVAGLAIEKAARRPYYELLQERILGPLRLTETTPSNRRRIAGLVSGQMTPHENYFGLDSGATMRNGELLYNPALEWTGGGLAASSRDLARWAQLLYSGRALPEPYLDDLFTSVPTGQPRERYGLGVEIGDRAGEKSYGHTGSIPGYRAAVRYFPATRTAVAIQYNADIDQDGLYAKLIAAARTATPALGAGGRSRTVRCGG